MTNPVFLPVKILLAAALALLIGWGTLHAVRLYQIATFFSADNIVHNFTHMNRLFTTRPVASSRQPQPLATGAPLELPTYIRWDGGHMKTADFLAYSGTTGLLVLKNGEVRHESYHLGHSAEQPHISWSVAKSMISALIGIAVSEGKISSVNDPVDQYAADLRGTAYAGIRLKDVLQMSSGIAFNEDYHDPDSDIARLASVAILGGSFNAYAQQLRQARPAGTHNEYISFDTQVLAMVLEGATGTSLADYMSTRLWQPIGAEHPGYWIVDSKQMAMGFGGFNATTRDYARFGQLFLQQGRWGDQQIVPAEWIQESLQMDGDHLRADNIERTSFLGYGYQWWIPDHAERDYLAIGVYNQFIYISPQHNVVIVKNSANHHYESEFDDLTTTWLHLMMFRQIAASIDAPGQGAELASASHR